MRLCVSVCVCAHIGRWMCWGGICSMPHRTWKCGTRPFLDRSGRRAVAHTHLVFPKNVHGPVGIPFIRGTSGTGRSTHLPRRGKSLVGKAPWGRRKIFSYWHTPGQIGATPSSAGQSVTRQLNATSRYEEVNVLGQVRFDCDNFHE